MLRQFRAVSVDQAVYRNGDEIRGAVIAEGVPVKRRDADLSRRVSMPNVVVVGCDNR